MHLSLMLVVTAALVTVVYGQDLGLEQPSGGVRPFGPGGAERPGRPFGRRPPPFARGGRRGRGPFGRPAFLVDEDPIGEQPPLRAQPRARPVGPGGPGGPGPFGAGLRRRSPVTTNVFSLFALPNEQTGSVDVLPATV